VLSKVPEDPKKLQGISSQRKLFANVNPEYNEEAKEV
jgi:hypothetical protein